MSLCVHDRDTRRTATEQLLISDAIDRAVDRLDPTPLAGLAGFLNTTPLEGQIDREYLVSTLRQKPGAMPTTSVGMAPGRKGFSNHYSLRYPIKPYNRTRRGTVRGSTPRPKRAPAVCAAS